MIAAMNELDLKNGIMEKQFSMKEDNFYLRDADYDNGYHTRTQFFGFMSLVEEALLEKLKRSQIFISSTDEL
jgi:hypothetical protein